MKIITYSDLHLEFGDHIEPPLETEADLLILSGDIMTFSDFSPLSRFLRKWIKPVLYVAGNHEYYNYGGSINKSNIKFKNWLFNNHKNVKFLYDEEINIEGINFFGGTMWTNFNNADADAMEIAKRHMNDYRLIIANTGKILEPIDTIYMHKKFVEKITKWFEKDLEGPRVVITHHAPIIKPNTRHEDSILMPAFNSLDMPDLIKKYQPNIWIYGHTHECDDHMLGNTRIISNQLGYRQKSGEYECEGFDIEGKIFSADNSKSN